MRINKIEILKNTSNNQYDEILYPRTTIENVITSSESNLDHELNFCYDIISNIENSSKALCIVESKTNKLKINNENYIFMDSGLVVYLNGILLVENLNYVILSTSEIELIGFMANIGDEIVFEVVNKFKPNIDLDYKSFPRDTQEALTNLLNSTNLMVSDVNNFKNMIIMLLNNIGVDVSMSSSYEEITNAIRQNLKQETILSDEFGGLFGKPKFEYDIEFNLGCLFGYENNVSYFNNDLGGI